MDQPFLKKKKHSRYILRVHRGELVLAVSCTSTALLTRSPSSAPLLFLVQGSPTKLDYRKKGTLILSSLLEDLGDVDIMLARNYDSFPLGIAMVSPPDNGPVMP